jgi:predicted nucleic acid-binding Zn ribbon protein
VDNGAVDPALAALEAARGMARGRPVPRRRRREREAEPRRRGGYSGARPDDTDPQPIGRLFAEHAGDRGWERPLNEARIFSDWARIVGADVAAHCTPTALREGELRVAAESTAWATQLRLLAGTLLARIVAEVGGQVVSRLVIAGPAAPSWRHGPRSVRGARGPRDTYG